MGKRFSLWVALLSISIFSSGIHCCNASEHGSNGTSVDPSENATGQETQEILAPAATTESPPIPLAEIVEAGGQLVLTTALPSIPTTRSTTPQPTTTTSTTTSSTTTSTTTTTSTSTPSSTTSTTTTTPEPLPQAEDNSVQTTGATIGSQLSGMQSRGQMGNTGPRTGQQESTDVDLTDQASLMAEALADLSNMTSLDTLLESGMMMTNGHQATAADFDIETNSTTGKKYINGNGAMMGEIPPSDGCSPREKSVTINITNVDASLIVFPRCIKVERCGGCCSMPSVTCKPHYTETVILSLLLLRPVTRRNRVKVENAGIHTVRVERHVVCQCKCQLSQAKCGSLKTFSERKCSCKCKRRLTCATPTVFNEETCRCECPKHLRDNCAGTLLANTCECRYFVSSGNASSLNAANSQQRSSADSLTALSSPSSTTSEDSTPTTAATSPASRQNSDPCATVNCPAGRVPLRSGIDTCRCRPLVRGATRPRPRPGPRPRPRPRPRPQSSSYTRRLSRTNGRG